MTGWRSWCGGAVLGLALLAACGDEAAQPTAPDAEDPDTALVATWLTQGQDPDLGPVEVRMALRADGSLRLTVTPDTGGSLIFGGTWTRDGGRMHLRGAWFQPDGEVDVDWRLEDDALVLTDTAGREQTWQRVG